MTQLFKSFNIDSLPQGGGKFGPLPAGWYSATVAGAEIKTTKAGTGEYIAVRYDITGPTHHGRVVFGNFNIRNPNPKAEEVAYQQLGELMRATGLSNLEDSDQLTGCHCIIKLSVRESEEYGSSNDVKGWRATSTSALPEPGPAPATGAPPWGNR